MAKSPADMEPLDYLFHASPVGPLLVAGTRRAIRLISFANGNRPVHPKPHWRQVAGAFATARHQLDRYFLGTLTEFDLTIELRGDAFALAVWQALREIPFGRTVSYGVIAERLGYPRSASRAVGSAIGANPVPIVVPCHRVIGADGSLTGFGGGLAIKRFLLDLELRTRPMPGEQLRLPL